MKATSIRRILSVLMCLTVLLMLFGCKDNSSSGVSSKSATSAGNKSDNSQNTEDLSKDSSDITSESVSSWNSPESAASNASVSSKKASNTVTSSSGKTSSASASSVSSKPRPAVDPTKLYGLGYVQYIMNSQVSNDQVVALAEALGVQSMRVWNHATFVMSDYKTIDKKAAEPYHDLYKKLKAKGIQIVAMNHFHYLLPDYPALTPDGWPSSGQVPPYDKTPGSDYLRFLEQYEVTWKVLADEFPEVDVWEIGNEWNHDDFLSPYGYYYKPEVKPFSTETKADVSTDMMFAANKGIKASKSKAITTMPAMAPVDGINGKKTLDYLERIYQNIKSGKFGSTNTDDFFQALAWHPYYNRAIDDEWVKQNNDIYAIAQKYGDGDKKVYLTEVGFVDQGSSIMDRHQGQWIKDMYRLARQKMPYVESIHYYWMFTSKGSETAGETYALFDENFGAKKKAIAYQEMTGAKGNLNMLKK